MNEPVVHQLGPGYDKAAQLGERTVFFSSAKVVQPMVLSADGTMRRMNALDWRHMKAAEEKRRARATRNLGLK